MYPHVSTRSHTHARTRTHTHAHARTRTHTRTQNARAHPPSPRTFKTTLAELATSGRILVDEAGRQVSLPPHKTNSSKKRTCSTTHPPPAYLHPPSLPHTHARIHTHTHTWTHPHHQVTLLKQKKSSKKRTRPVATGDDPEGNPAGSEADNKGVDDGTSYQSTKDRYKV